MDSLCVIYQTDNVCRWRNYWEGGNSETGMILPGEINFRKESMA